MKFSPRLRSSVWKIICAALFAGGLMWLSSSVACKKPVDPSDTSQVVLPRENVVAFVKRSTSECVAGLTALNAILEPAGTQDTADARVKWFAARKPYERMRFAIEQFLPYTHHSSAMWHSENPQAGFHYIERYLFAPSPKLSLVYSQEENLMANIASVPGLLDNAGVSDEGVFRGLQYMLADIDTVKLSGLDTNYANNSVADAVDNLDALDTVHMMYKSRIVTGAAAADSLFSDRLIAARTMLRTAGTLKNLDKTAFRTDKLTPLRESLKSIATALSITLP